MKTFIFTAFNFAILFVFEQLSKFLLASRNKKCINGNFLIAIEFNENI